MGGLTKLIAHYARPGYFWLSPTTVARQPALSYYEAVIARGGHFAAAES